MPTSRRSMLSGLAAAVPTSALAVEPPRDIQAAMDFDEVWRTLDERYCFFHLKTTDWAKARAYYRPRAIACDDIGPFREVIRQLLAELYDPHTHVNDLPDGAPRTPPFDIWAQWRSGRPMVFDVRSDSPAAAAGVRPGDELVEADGLDIRSAAAAQRPRFLSRPDPEAEDYALRAAVAGHRARPRTIKVLRAGRALDLAIAAVPIAEEPPVSWRRLDGGLGLIRISTFADDKVVAAWDAALAQLKETRA